MKRTVWLVAVSAVTVLAGGRAQAKDAGIFTISLRYAPQESVADASVVLAPGLPDRPLALALADGRAGADPAVIGDRSDDDDHVWPVKASNDVVGWADEVLRKNAADWGIKTAADAPLKLGGKLTRFHTLESNKALGSTYNAEVQVAFTLTNAAGQSLWEGSAAGDATRYGKSRSEENTNEVISDAVKEAYANLFNDAGLQNAWGGKAAPHAGAAPAGPAVAPSALLADLVKLKGKGFDTSMLVDFVNQQTLSATLSADDLVAWKNAGMPDAVIKAAIARAKG